MKSKIKTKSEGEEFLSQFFKANGIKAIYEDQKNYPKNLFGDSKKYRKPDFYLSRYKIFVEFNGRWNVSK